MSFGTRSSSRVRDSGPVEAGGIRDRSSYNSTRYELIQGRLYVGKQPTPSQLTQMRKPPYRFDIIAHINDEPTPAQAQQMFETAYEANYLYYVMAINWKRVQKPYHIRPIMTICEQLLEHMMGHDRVKVLIHCAGGHGRSFMIGMILWCVVENCSVDEFLSEANMARIRASRPTDEWGMKRLPEFENQEEMARQVVPLLRIHYNAPSFVHGPGIVGRGLVRIMAASTKPGTETSVTPFTRRADVIANTPFESPTSGSEDDATPPSTERTYASVVRSKKGKEEIVVTTTVTPLNTNRRKRVVDDSDL